MPAGKRHVLLQHLGRLDQGERGLLANARCLAEGVDVPTLDSVAFIDPRRSEVDVVQAVGRAIRLAAEKTVGTIVVPVFIDTDEDPEIALDSSAFKPVWDVIKALRSHDDQLGEQLDELRRQLGRREGRPRLPGKIHLDLPTKVGGDFASAFNVRLLEQATVSWEFRLGLLERFIRSTGHARVPADYTTEDGYRLGWWVMWQRELRSKGTLDADRQRRLDELPGWTWDPRADNWEAGFTRLLDYVERHGNARVPRSHKVDDFRLGLWVGVQRRSFGKGSLDADRVRRLEEVPDWSWDPFTDQWEEGFGRLRTYVARTGDTHLPRSYVVDGYNLGAWVKKQRGAFNKGLLDADRQRRLEELPGWSWDPLADQWEIGFSRLVKYIESHGDADVPQSYTVSGYNLGSWVQVQRRARVKGTLDAERERRLNQLPDWRWKALDKWEEGFSRLLDFVKHNGNACVPRWAVTEDGYRLGAWINQQRNNHEFGTLTAPRERRLEELPGWTWDVRAQQWEEGFGRLLDYVKRHSDARVPSSYTVDDYRLGQWVNTQRAMHAKGNLDADRTRRLQELPGWSWNSRTDMWEKGYRRLLEYVNEKGNARVPKPYEVDGYDLGSWVNTQRTKHARGELNVDRERRLREVPGWSWDPFADQWEDGFRQLIRYVRHHGNARVPWSYVIDGFHLGRWVAKQRAVFNRGGGDAERCRRLQELPGWTSKASSST